MGIPENTQIFKLTRTHQHTHVFLHTRIHPYHSNLVLSSFSCNLITECGRIRPSCNMLSHTSPPQQAGSCPEDNLIYRRVVCSFTPSASPCSSRLTLMWFFNCTTISQVMWKPRVYLPNRKLVSARHKMDGSNSNEQRADSRRPEL